MAPGSEIRSRDGKKRLVGTVKDDILQANEVVWSAMVAGVSHMGNVG